MDAPVYEIFFQQNFNRDLCNLVLDVHDLDVKQTKSTATFLGSSARASLMQNRIPIHKQQEEIHKIE
jgi:hypothetical protein